MPQETTEQNTLTAQQIEEAVYAALVRFEKQSESSDKHDSTAPTEIIGTVALSADSLSTVQASMDNSLYATQLCGVLLLLVGVGVFLNAGIKLARLLLGGGQL